MAEGTRKVKVFISWSGDLSRSIALSLRTFLPRVIQSLEPWVSDVDISKGTLWNAAIMKNLKESRFGIVVVTNENVTKPWLHYETGYMSHYIEDDQNGLVSPLLVEVPTSSLAGPMTSLQATLFERSDVLRLLEDVNRRLDEPLTKENLEYYFAHAWDEFDGSVAAALTSGKNAESAPEPFNQEKVLTQILDTVRDLARSRHGSTWENSVLQLFNGRRLHPSDIGNRQPDFILSGPTTDETIVELKQYLNEKARDDKDPQDGGNQADGDQATQ